MVAGAEDFAPGALGFAVASDGASGGSVSGIGVSRTGTPAAEPPAARACGPTSAPGGIDTTGAPGDVDATGAPGKAAPTGTPGGVVPQVGGAVTTGTGGGTGALPGGASGTAVIVSGPEGEDVSGDVVAGVREASGAMGTGGGAPHVLGASNDPVGLSRVGGATCAVARLSKPQATARTTQNTRRM
jgi:hypothetical protein